MAKIICDYSDKEKDAKQKKERLDAINDLIKLLSDQNLVTRLFIPNIEIIIDMIKKIFSVIYQTQTKETQISVKLVKKKKIRNRSKDGHILKRYIKLF